VIVLGLSGGHDGNWCLVADGVVLGAYEKERFTRVKHDGGEVLSLVPGTLADLGIDCSAIDIVATTEPVYRGTGPGLNRITDGHYDAVDDWQWHEVECLGRRLRCLYVPHHLAHASYARYSAGFESTAVITWDGGGDFNFGNAYACTTLSSWRGPRLEWIERIPESDLGSLWAVYARHLFGDRHAAGKVMGLAAYGSQRLVEPMAERFLRPVEGRLAGADTLIDPYPALDPAPFFDEPCDWQAPVAADAAAALQAVTTRAGTSLAAHARTVTGHANLALAGGVALNGYLTTAIRRSAGFDEVFVPPAVHDGGLAVGCAQFAAHHVLGEPYVACQQENLAFLGRSYSQERCRAAIGHDGRRVDVDDAEIIAARLLSQGGIVGWFEGRSEHGPRALGHRSILSGVTSTEIRDRLNRDIKFREPFRPVAPVVPDDQAADWFDMDWSSPLMMYIVESRSETKRMAPAAVHTDGTSRVQTVAADTSLARVAKHYGELTGVPIIVNTSLNVRSPIVETPEEAVDVFGRVPLDALYLDGWLIERGGRS
jgi:carbamoyltransferase